MTLTSYIKQPELLDAASVEELSALVERYPYFHAARLLLLRGLYQIQSDRFGAELRQAALFIPDRSRLFELIEGEKFKVETANKPVRVQHEVAASTDRTQSLIDSFLSTQTDEPKPRRTRVVDASADYMGFLMQMEGTQEEEVGKGLSAEVPNPLEEASQQSIGKEAENALQKEEKMEAETFDEIDLDEEDDFLPLGYEESDENAPSEAFFTETLARIYIKQHKYSKAIEIIRRLNLNYPKKSRYFADQIRFLEKLLLNESSK
ncbi:MAG: hypothetical protein J5545_06745 [Bacteroidaceae bacterium]|nr:hypothetical protein [Bacteroidaceae bacterium]